MCKADCLQREVQRGVQHNVAVVYAANMAVVNWSVQCGAGLHCRVWYLTLVMWC